MKTLLCLLALVLACLPIAARADTVTVDVTFKMTELEQPDHPVANVPVRLVLGQAPNWQAPDAGHKFTTDDKGEAHFTMEGVVDKRLQMESGILPASNDHMMVAAELEQPIPAKDGKLDHVQWLHTLDIDCPTADDCSTSDITGVYTRDDKGQFTVAGTPGPSGEGLSMPELKGMVLGGPGYKAVNYMLAPVDGDRKHWTLSLWLQRNPPPVMR